MASLFAKSEIDINNDNKISLGEYVSSLHNGKDIDFVNLLLSIGEKLNINVDFYRMKIDKLLHV